MPVSHTRILVIGAALLTACLKRNPGFQDDTGESGPMLTTGATSTGPAPTTGTVTTDMSPGTGGTAVDGTTSSDASSSTGAVVPTSGDATSSTSTSTSTGEATTSSATDTSTGEPATPATCAEARAQGGVTSGVYTLQVPQNPGATVDVWCEQEVADGGWLLVGRSAAGGMPPGFGWSFNAGDLDNDDEPYALNLLVLKFPATEVLLAARDDGKQPGDHVYRFKTPAGFPLGFDLDAGPTSEIETVLGDCAPAGGPATLRWLGFTKLDDRFRLRDLADGGAGDIHGLHANGFVMPEDCDNGGELNGSQGVIFVR